MGTVIAPTLTTNATGGKIIHTGLDALIAQIVVATECVDFVGGNLTEVSNKLRHLVYAAPKLISEGKHTE